MKKILFLLITALVVTNCSNTSYEGSATTEIVARSENKLNKNLREVPFEKKIYKNKLAYASGDSTPFTGVFTSRYIGHLLYFEEYQNGLLNGNKVWFGDDGTIGLKQSFVNNIQTGNQLTYFKNGRIRSIFPYVNGKLEGTIEWYNEDGLLYDMSEIKNGSGRYVIYWNNGRKKIIGNLKNNKPVGLWKEYTISGELQKEITYSNSGFIAKQKWYK